MSAYVLWWIAIGAATPLSFATKLAGHLVPSRVVDNPRIHAIAALITVALLAALTAVQTFTTAQELIFDARVVGLAAGALALMLRAPFLVVVCIAAAVAASLRALGWG